MFRFVIIAAFISPTIASANCRIAVAGTSCVAVPQKPRELPVAIGDIVDRGQYNMVMNLRYFGLPNVTDGWVYMDIEGELYRVDWATHEVLQRVTHRANENWKVR